MGKKTSIDHKNAKNLQKETVYRFMKGKNKIDLPELYQAFPDIPKASLRAYRMNHLKQLKAGEPDREKSFIEELTTKIKKLEARNRELEDLLDQKVNQSPLENTGVSSVSRKVKQTLQDIDRQVLSLFSRFQKLSFF